MGRINLYTVVTNDEYEFPVKCDLRVGEVAEFLHTTPGYIRQMVFRPRRKSKYKVVVTGRITFDRKAYSKQYSITHDRSEYFRQRYRRLKDEERDNYERVPT